MDFVKNLASGAGAGTSADNADNAHKSTQQPAAGSGGGFMDKINDLAGGGGSGGSANKSNQSGASSGGGFMDKINSLAGGGKQSEANEDGLDKAIDFVQEKFLGQGDQSNESAAEQAKDEAISDFIRDKYKAATGNDFPIPDKERKSGLF